MPRSSRSIWTTANWATTATCRWASAATAAAVIAQLTDAIAPGHSNSDNWLRTLREDEDKRASQAALGLNSDQVPIHPLRLCKEINDFLTEDTVFIGDGGDIVTMSASVIRTHKPGHWLDPGPLGTLGVRHAVRHRRQGRHAGKRTSSCCSATAPLGSPASTSTPQCASTCRFVSVVGNNAGWNQIRYGQLAKYGEQKGDVANKLSATRYDVIVEAMGGYGECVTEPGDIRPGHGAGARLGQAVVRQRHP